MTLSPHPRGGVVVPLVTGIGQAAERGFDVVPTPFVVKTAPDQLADERASPPPARAPVNLCHEVVGESYVQTHGPKTCTGRTRPSIRPSDPVAAA